MSKLYHFPLCPFSRRIRLALTELGFEVELIEERTWNRREEFLAMNPAGTLPVLVDAGGRTIAGITAITEFLEEVETAEGRRSLIPGTPHVRAEVRRLVEWFDIKFYDEVTRLIAHEMIEKRYRNASEGGGGPNMEAVRIGRQNIGYHLQYIDYLMAGRRWLAGDSLSHADLAAAAHLSCVDYTGNVPWEEAAGAKDWYARVKSRPGFRPLLKDQVPGMQPPPHYEDLDF